MSAASRLAAICYPTLLKYRAHWLMLTARPESGNGVGKYSCLSSGSRWPPNFRSFSKTQLETWIFLRFSPAVGFYEKHPRKFWKERFNRPQFRSVESALQTCLTPGPAAVRRHLGAKKHMFGSHDPQAGTLCWDTHPSELESTVSRISK